MAAGWKIGGGMVSNVVGNGKRLQLPTRLIPSSSSLPYRQDSISAAYGKNPDDQAPQSMVPDDPIQPESEEYWAPDPQTGVFTPPSDRNGVEAEAHSSPPAGSVLEEEAFFRPTSIEDSERPITVPDLEVNE